MAGGTLTISVPNYAMLQQVAQRVSCWAGGVAGFRNVAQIRLRSTTTQPALIIPEVLFSIGPLLLEPGGANLLAGYVAGTHITFSANNGLAAAQNPNTCAADNAQVPLIDAVATNVGGNPLSVNLTYTNFAGNGGVTINWGDGSALQTAAAETNTINHVYPFQPGTFVLRVSDTTDLTLFTETTIQIP